MKKILTVITILALACVAIPAFGQDQPDPFGVEVERLNDHLYRVICIDSFSANVTASVGPDGILIVDAGMGTIGDTLLAVLKTLGNGDVRYVISTHGHGDHIGGNTAFSSIATIVAHRNAGKRLDGTYYALEGPRDTRAPHLVFDDSITIHFNGEDIRMWHVPPAHTDGDIMVHFTRSNIWVVADLLFPDAFPFVDLNNGGDVDGYVAQFQGLLNSLPPDARVVGGHGRVYGLDDLRQFDTMLTTTIKLIRDQMAAGKNSQDMIAENLLADWHSWATGFIKEDQWITTVYANDIRRSRPTVISISKPLTEVLVSEGIEAAILKYHQLKRDEPEKYDFLEDKLNMLGYQLLNRNMVDEAVEIFKLNAEAYPESGNVYDSYGEGLMKKGDTEGAIANYEKSLQLDPDNSNAVEMLKKLRGQ